MSLDDDGASVVVLVDDGSMPEARASYLRRHRAWCARRHGKRWAKWSEAEDRALRLWWATDPDRARRACVGRTARSVQQRALTLGIGCITHRPWSEAEEATLRSIWGGKGGRRALRRALPGRSWEAIERHALRIGLHGREVASMVSATVAASVLRITPARLVAAVEASGVRWERRCYGRRPGRYALPLDYAVAAAGLRGETEAARARMVVRYVAALEAAVEAEQARRKRPRGRRSRRDSGTARDSRMAL